jgi:malyl-CoA/(S)-citramalyl-CoA lyase
MWCDATPKAMTTKDCATPTNKICGTTPLRAWLMHVLHGIFAFYGPFGDIKDTVACEDQFRNAYLLGCVGAWSLHPVQIDIAKRVFSPRPEDVRQAQRVIEAMGDGTGAIMLDGKMEDDASVKQCKVVVELARQLAERDPHLAESYGF